MTEEASSTIILGLRGIAEHADARARWLGDTLLGFEGPEREMKMLVQVREKN